MTDKPEITKPIANAEIGVLERFATKGEIPPDATRVRLMKLGYLQYGVSPDAKTPAQIVAENKRVFAEMKVAIGKLDPKNPRGQWNDYKFTNRFEDSTKEPCRRLHVTAAGWLLLKPFGIDPGDKKKVCR